MNLSAGYPYDLIRTGLPYDYPRLQQDLKTDVVILGGGISGALTAYHLISAGIGCVVVDGRTIGLGSTCASTSLLQYEIDEPLWRLSERIGEEPAARAYSLCAEAINDLEKIARIIGHDGFKRCRSIYFAASDRDISFLEKEFDARKNAGFNVDWMSSARLKKQYGLSSAAAILSAPAAQTSAYRFTHDLHQYSIAKGAKVYDRAKIEKIEHTSKGVKLVTQDGYVLRCKKLVYATGYESVKYIKEKIVQLHATYACISEQLPPGVIDTESIFWNTAKPYLYMRGTNDNRVLVGGRDMRYTSFKKMDNMIKHKTNMLQRDLGNFFPVIPFKPEFSWAGIFGSTKDGLPFIGNYPGLANSLFALGFGGNGITFSQIAARMITDSFSKPLSNDFSLFSFNRP